MKSIKKNFDALFIGLSVIFIWRAAWNMLDFYFLPEYRLISLLIPAFIGFIYLFTNDFKIDELR